MSSSFDIQLTKRAFKGNIVIAITDNSSVTTYFSQHDVDNGLTVDYSGYVIDASVNGEELDLRDIKSTIPSLSFSLLDKNLDISSFISTDASTLMNYDVKFYYGFITGSYGWGNYQLIANTKITGLSKKANSYSFTSQAPAGLLQSRIYTTKSTLASDLIITGNIALVDASEFSTSGIGIVNDEFFTWTGKSTNTLTGVTRGGGLSAPLTCEASAHDKGTNVFEVTLIEDESMNIMLDIILNQVGVASTLVDSDAFTSLRDSDFDSDGDFTFYLWDIENALTWLEDNILLVTNTRLISKDGKISIAALDQVAFAIDSEKITENHIIGEPTYSVDVRKVVNKIVLKYDYNWGTTEYETVREFTSSTSITNYGEQKELVINMKGITTTNNGIGFANTKSRKLLARLDSPTAEITVNTLFNRFNINPADQIFLEHRYLPQPGSGGEFNYMLEVLSKAPKDFKNNPSIKFKLAFTSYGAIRYGLISPSPLIASVTSQKIFTVPDGTLFEAGYFLRLWDDSDGDFYSDDANEIESITGNEITMTDDFVTTLTTSIRIVFPEYDESSSAQQQRYAYVCPDTNIFINDSSNAYNILP